MTPGDDIDGAVLGEAPGTGLPGGTFPDGLGLVLRSGDDGAAVLVLGANRGELGDTSDTGKVDSDGRAAAVGEPSGLLFEFSVAARDCGAAADVGVVGVVLVLLVSSETQVAWHVSLNLDAIVAAACNLRKATNSGTGILSCL